jgi:hypothetical protein
MRLSRRLIASVGAAVVAGFLPLAMAKAESASDNPSWSSWADVFTKSVHDQTAVSGQSDWSDVSALGYARSARSDTAAVQWLPPQPLPAVDGINAKIDGYGGGANHSNGFYGTNGSLSVPLAHQWGLQVDGGIGSGDGIVSYGGAGHLFWRDPSIGLLGFYGSYSHWNGIDTGDVGHISANTGRYAAEGEYYLSRWTIGGVAGVEMLSFNSDVASLSVPNRFFDVVTASYYVTDNFKLSIGHRYIFDRNALALGGEHGFALGGGRMAALFTEGTLGEHGTYSALAGLRIYFGQHDKTLIERNRQDDPPSLQNVNLSGPVIVAPNIVCPPGFFAPNFAARATMTICRPLPAANKPLPTCSSSLPAGTVCVTP